MAEPLFDHSYEEEYPESEIINLFVQNVRTSFDENGIDASDGRIVKAMEKLSNGISALVNANRQTGDTAINNSEGFEEQKLLESIEKWQRRYQDSEQNNEELTEKYENVASQYNMLLDDYKSLQDAHEELSKHEREVSMSYNDAINAANAAEQKVGASLKLIDQLISDVEEHNEAD